MTSCDIQDKSGAWRALHDLHHITTCDCRIAVREGHHAPHKSYYNDVMRLAGQRRECDVQRDSCGMTSCDLQDSSGSTALHEAVSDNNAHLARLLLRHGADVTAQEHIGQLTPLQAVSVVVRLPNMRMTQAFFDRLCYNPLKIEQSDT